MNIDYAKLTGEVGDRGFHYQVKMATGESLYAPMLITGNTSIVPTKDWVSANKDSFLAVIGYQGSDYNDPFIIGFLPVKNAKSKDYNTFERTFRVLQDLVDQLLKAKVNTQIGPQPFMSDTIGKFKECEQELKEIDKLIKEIG